MENKIKCVASENGTIIPIHNIALISPGSHYVWTNGDGCDPAGHKLCDKQYYALLKEIEFIGDLF